MTCAGACDDDRDCTSCRLDGGRDRLLLLAVLLVVLVGVLVAVT